MRSSCERSSCCSAAWPCGRRSRPAGCQGSGLEARAEAGHDRRPGAAPPPRQPPAALAPRRTLETAVVSAARSGEWCSRMLAASTGHIGQLRGRRFQRQHAAKCPKQTWQHICRNVCCSPTCGGHPVPRRSVCSNRSSTQVGSGCRVRLGGGCQQARLQVAPGAGIGRPAAGKQCVRGWPRGKNGAERCPLLHA